MNLALLTLSTRLRTLATREEGQSLVEYSLILALIAVGCVTILGTLGGNVLAKLTAISNAL